MMTGKLRFATVHVLLAFLLWGSASVGAQGTLDAADVASQSRGSDSEASPQAAAARPSAGDASSSVELSEVVVTGTRIPGTAPTSPVTTLDRQMIDESGVASIGELLLEIPENFSGGQNPGVVGARGNNQVTISGAYSANLHGLGADSTLTLLDGHRFAYDAFQNGVDLSVVPLAAVDRVEILTDGASAIYGSDAVAGVVNVILKQHYDGVTADARYGGVTRGHSAQSQYSLLGGHDWTSGNALVAYEYSHSDALYASDRPFSAGAPQPTTLLPELNRNTGFARLRQQLAESITASVDALYTARSDVQVSTTGRSINYGETTVRQYGVSPSLDFDLPGEWAASLEGSVSHDRDDQVLPTLDAVSGSVTRTSTVAYENDLRLVEIHGSGPVLRLPSGPVELAIGIGYRYERFRNLLPPTSSTPSVDANRNVRFAYGEVEVPLVEPDATRAMLRRFDVNAAVRYERYSDFGAQTTPKIGFIYIPSAYVHIRATWSESFRAPEFFDVVGPRQLYLFPAAPFGGAAGTTAFLAFGANTGLGPEKARSTTAGFEVLWPSRRSFRLSPTYFHIDYDERIVQPIDNMARALSNPLYAPFITLDPSVPQQQALLSQATYFVNFAGVPYQAQSVSAVLDDREQNATAQRIDGVDLTARDAWPLWGGELDLLAGGTWLRIVQRTVPAAPEVDLTGTVFNPPRFKSRASATWRRAGWSMTAAFNYVGRESDNTGRVVLPVSSWSTVDAQLSYAFPPSTHGLLHGVKASLSVQNLLDRAPPHLAATSTTYPALSFDSTNASALGRFVGAYLAKSW